MTTINVRIAKAKGWECYKVADDEFVGIPPKFYNDEGVNPRSRDWSGSIADAWDLVEEMRRVGEPKFRQFTDAIDVLIQEEDGPPDPEVGKFYIPSCDLMYWLSSEVISLAWLAVNEVG